MIRNILLAALTAATAAGAFAQSRADDYSQYYTDLPFETPVVQAPEIPELTVDIKDFGGVGDGITLNTEAFCNAIRHLSNQGGGHLNVGRGVWLTGPITMRSNIDLHIEKEAIVVFSPDRTLYSVNRPDGATTSSYVTAPINADGESNFSITGEGILDGNGEVWRPAKKMKFGEWEWNRMVKSGGSLSADGSIWYPTSAADEAGQKRPRLIRLVRCNRVMVKGVVVQNSPSFHVNLFCCTDIIIDSVTVRCPWNAQNGDGIDLSSCRRALIVNSTVDCGDDAICMKSGAGQPGRDRGPTTDVVVDGCTVYHGHGGFVIGSDESGGMRNIAVRRSRFVDTDTGLRFKSGRDRGGVVENVYIDDIVMNDIDGEAILFEMYYQQKVPLTGDVAPAPVTADTPLFRNFTIRNVVCREAGRAILMQGLPEQRLSNITIANCAINAHYGIQINEANDITLEGITLQISDGPAIGLNNTSGVSIRNLDAGGIDTTPVVTGSRND